MKCKHRALRVIRRSQKFRPAADPLSVGWPKFNQLEMVTTLTQFGEDRYMQF